MRTAAIIFGILGVAGSGGLGAKWLSDASEIRGNVELARKVNEQARDEDLAAKLAHHDQVVRGAYALVGGAVLGLIGLVLLFRRQGAIAGVLFLVAFAAPFVFVRKPELAIFTFGLLVAGLMSFAVRPRLAPGSTWGDDLETGEPVDPRPRYRPGR